MTHPYERLGLAARRRWAIGCSAAWLVLTGLLTLSVPPAHLELIARLASAGDVEAARLQQASWPAEVSSSAAFLFGYDFLYDLVHNTAAAFLCLWGAALLGGRSLLFARGACWALWLCTILNVPENFAFLELVRGGIDETAFAFATLSTAFRGVVLWVSAPAGLLLVVTGLLRGRASAP